MISSAAGQGPEPPDKLRPNHAFAGHSTTLGTTTASLAIQGSNQDRSTTYTLAIEPLRACELTINGVDFFRAIVAEQAI